MSSKICFNLLQISSHLFLLTFIKNNFFISKSCQDDPNITIMPLNMILMLLHIIIMPLHSIIMLLNIIFMPLYIIIMPLNIIIVLRELFLLHSREQPSPGSLSNIKNLQFQEEKISATKMARSHINMEKSSKKPYFFVWRNARQRATQATPHPTTSRIRGIHTWKGFFSNIFISILNGFRANRYEQMEI